MVNFLRDERAAASLDQKEFWIAKMVFYLHVGGVLFQERGDEESGYLDAVKCLWLDQDIQVSLWIAY